MANISVEVEIGEQFAVMHTLLQTIHDCEEQMSQLSKKGIALGVLRQKMSRELRQAQTKMASLYVRAGAIRVIPPQAFPRCGCEGADVSWEVGDPATGEVTRSVVVGARLSSSLCLLDAWFGQDGCPYSATDTVVLNDRLYRYLDGKWTPVSFAKADNLATLDIVSARR